MSDSTNSIISKIKNFGQDAAEQENSRDYLAQHFIQTNAYKKALDGTKSIIIGRKGSGKSAIFLYLKHGSGVNDDTSRAFIIPDSSSANKIRGFIKEDLNSQASKMLAWRYIFLVMVAKFVFETGTLHKDERTWSTQIKKIRKFLEAI